MFIASPFPSTFGLLLARSWSISKLYQDARNRQAGYICLVLPRGRLTWNMIQTIPEVELDNLVAQLRAYRKLNLDALLGGLEVLLART